MTESTLHLRRTNVPAKQLPAGLWIDVLAVLKAHGLEPSPTNVISGLAQIIRHTPTADGGRLCPDGRIDNDDLPDVGTSWFCNRCGRDLWSLEAKESHDRACSGLLSPGE